MFLLVLLLLVHLGASFFLYVPDCQRQEGYFLLNSFIFIPDLHECNMIIWPMCCDYQTISDACQRWPCFRGRRMPRLSEENEALRLRAAKAILQVLMSRLGGKSVWEGLRYDDKCTCSRKMWYIRLWRIRSSHRIRQVFQTARRSWSRDRNAEKKTDPRRWEIRNSYEFTRFDCGEKNGNSF